MVSTAHDRNDEPETGSTVRGRSPVTPSVRRATVVDIEAVRGLGGRAVRDTYGRLRGDSYAEDLLATYWSWSALQPAVTAGLVLVAVDAGVVGMAERGEALGEPVLWKLYVEPGRRGEGIGAALVAATVADLPAGTARVLTEHLVENHRAAAFYEREGFAVLDAGEDVVWRARALTADAADRAAVGR